MNGDIHKGATCYGLYDEGEIVAFIGVIHFPHPKNKKIKKVTRLVVLPDYQGIGIGMKFLNVVADFYKKDGFDFRIVTSAKNLINALNKSVSWKVERYEKGKEVSTKSRYKEMNKTVRKNVKIASAKFIRLP